MGKVTVKKDFSFVEKIYAFDPGGTTGYAVISIDRAHTCIRIDEIGEFHTWTKLRELIVWRANKNNSVVVHEDFVVRTLSANLIAVEVMGVIRFLCAENEIHAISQMPGDRYVVEKWYPNVIEKDFPSHYGSAVRHGILSAVKILGTSRAPILEYDIYRLRMNMVIA